MNLNCLSTDAPFAVFETFGFHSGRTADKFAGCTPLRSDNGLVFLPNVKPKPEQTGKKGFVCKICGYVYEGDELPEDFICPLCKHGAVDFEPIG